MPPPVSSNPEVASHYATQVGLTVQLAAAMKRLHIPGDWRNKAQVAQYLEQVAAVTREFSSASIFLSVDHYDAMREQAHVAGQFNVPVRDPWNTDSITAYLDAATKNLLADIDTQAADLEAQIEATAQQITLDAGRYEIIDAVHADSKAKGWVRVTKPGACSFCRMLATRGILGGALYKTRETASFQAHTRFDGKGGDCRCGVEPVFGPYEPTAQARGDTALYAEVTDGLHGKDALNAFRRALERPTD